MTFCFWADITSALLNKPIGGGEKQLSILANSLQQKGHIVNVIDFNIVDDSLLNGINVFSLRKRYKWYIPKYFTFYKLALELKSDVYFSRIMGWNHIIPLLVSKRLKAIYVQSIAADLDVDSFINRIKYIYCNKSFKYFLTRGLLMELLWPRILANADLIICQHKLQYALSKRFKNVTILNSLISLTPKLLVDSLSNDYLFIGSIDKRKGLMNMISIINRAEKCRFKIIGSPRDNVSKKLLTDFLSKNSNVDYIGKIDNNSVFEYISKSRAVLSVSEKEGFPNIFIEAWSLGKPVLSLFVDLGGIINDSHIGKAYYGNIDNLVYDLYHFDKLGMNSNEILSFFYCNYNNEITINKLISIINNLKKH